MIVKRSKSFYSIEDSLSFSVKDIENIKVLRKGEDGKSVAVSFKNATKDEKRFAITEMNETINALYSALNGERRNTGQTIGEFVKFVLNEGTFGSIFSTAVEFFMMDYIKPQLIVSSLLAETIPVGPQLNKSVIAAVRGMGMVQIGEVPRYGTLPTITPSLDEYAEQMAFDIKRYGVKLEVDRDLRDSDEWGILGFYLVAIADGFRYRKEYEVTRMINLVGKKVIDNSAPTTGALGVHTSGRGIDGSFNGTVSMEDFRKTFGYAAMRGHDITTILLHPLAVFNMFGDSELSNMLQSARIVSRIPSNPFSPGWDHPFADMGTLMRIFGGANVTGPAPLTTFGPDTTVPNFGELGVGPLGVPGVDPFSKSVNTLNAFAELNAQGPNGPLRVIVTPQVPVRKVVIGGITKLVTNVYCVSQSKPVAILQEQNPTMTEWEDMEKEVSTMAFNERYGVVPIRQGRGVYTIANVVIDRNYVIAPSYQYSFVGSASFGEPGTTPIV